MRAVAIVALLASVARADDGGRTPDGSGAEGRRGSSDGEVKLSLPTQADQDAWQTSGFRLGLGLAYGRLEGLRGPPSGRLLGAELHVGLRLDADWSLLATFQYASASASGELSGLRFSGTIDPTWHVTRHLSLAAGFGFGGIVEGRTDRVDPNPLAASLTGSYTFPDAKTPLPSCSGVGETGLVRVEYGWVLGPRAYTGVALELSLQYTGCTDRSTMVEPDTGQQIERHQYWAHAGAALSWGVMWR